MPIDAASDRYGRSRITVCAKSSCRIAARVAGALRGNGAVGTMGGGPTYVERATERTGCLPAKLERAIGCMRLIAGRTKFAHSMKLFLR
jgi:hypothetical protein